MLSLAPWLALVACAGIAAAAQAAPNVPMAAGAPGVDVYASTVDSPFYGCFRIPALVMTPHGDLLAFAEGRHPHCSDHAWNDVVMKRSADGGATWGSHNVTVVYGESTPSQFVTIGNPAPVVDAARGNLLLPCCRNNADVLLLQSSDWGASWSGARDITKQAKDPSWGWVATGPPGGLALESGRIVVPSDHIPSGGKTASHAMYSDDGGSTWHVSNSVDGGNECQAAVLGNGSLLLSMRTGNPHRQWAVSDDGGSTWGAPVADPMISETACEASIVALPDFPGGELLVLSSAFAESRTNMTLHVSRDAGASWRPAVNVYSGPSAYSSLIALNSTSIGLLYERDDYTKITYLAVNLEDALRGE